MLDDFGFTNRGRLELNISWISLSFRNNPLLDLSNNVGFFLYAHNSSRHTLKSEAATYCPPELRRDKGKDKIHKGLLLSPNLSNNTLVYHNETDPGHRVLIFVNCIEGMNVSMDIQWAMYNVLDGGNVRDYLPVGLSVLPRVYFFFSLVYVIVTSLWIYVLYKKRPAVLCIHLFMLAVPIAKVLKLVYDSTDMSCIKGTGRRLVDHGALFLYLFEFVTFFEGITYFTMLILITSGWLFLKPYLQLKDIIVLILLIPFQVIATMIQAQIEIDGSCEYVTSWFYLKSLFYVVECVCYALILLPLPTYPDNCRSRVLILRIKWVSYILFLFVFFTHFVLLFWWYMAPYKYFWFYFAAWSWPSSLFTSLLVICLGLWCNNRTLRV